MASSRPCQREGSFSATAAGGSTTRRRAVWPVAAGRRARGSVACSSSRTASGAAGGGGGAGQAGGARPGASELARDLPAERLDGREKRVHRRRLGELPDAAMIASGDDFFAVRDGRLLRWSGGGGGGGGQGRRRRTPRARLPLQPRPKTCSVNSRSSAGFHQRSRMRSRV